MSISHNILQLNEFNDIKQYISENNITLQNLIDEDMLSKYCDKIKTFKDFFVIYNIIKYYNWPNILSEKIIYAFLNHGNDNMIIQLITKFDILKKVNVFKFFIHGLFLKDESISSKLFDSIFKNLDLYNNKETYILDTFKYCSDNPNFFGFFNYITKKYAIDIFNVLSLIDLSTVVYTLACIDKFKHYDFFGSLILKKSIDKFTPIYNNDYLYLIETILDSDLKFIEYDKIIINPLELFSLKLNRYLQKDNHLRIINILNRLKNHYNIYNSNVNYKEIADIQSRYNINLLDKYKPKDDNLILFYQDVNKILKYSKEFSNNTVIYYCNQEVLNGVICKFSMIFKNHVIKDIIRIIIEYI